MTCRPADFLPILTLLRLFVVWAFFITLFHFVLVSPARSAGAYFHITVGDAVLPLIEDPELRQVLETQPNNIDPTNDGDTFRFATLYPDNVSYLNSLDATDDTDEISEVSHGGHFLTNYAKHIRSECADNPNGLLETKACREMIAHFMGSIVHIVTDGNFDMFFQRSVKQTCAWDETDGVDDPDLLDRDSTGSQTRPTDPNFFADQDLDVNLARTGRLSGWTNYPDTTGDVSASALDEVFIGVYEEDYTEFTYQAAIEEQHDITYHKQSDTGFERITGSEKTEEAGEGVARTPNPNACKWASYNDRNLSNRWRYGAGGLEDSARESAALVNRTWELMNARGVPFGRGNLAFRQHGKNQWPNLVTCVDAGGRVACDRARAIWPILIGQ